MKNFDNLDIQSKKILILVPVCDEELNLSFVIDELKSRGIRDKYIVMVGGAPLNDEFAEAIGADAYGSDAGSAVELAKKLVGDA